MNFKYITKIAAAAALLFANIPASAVFAPKGPLYLHIRNNTGYNFNIKQEEITQNPINTEIKAHTEKSFNQLPLIASVDKKARFDLTSRDLHIDLTVILSSSMPGYYVTSPGYFYATLAPYPGTRFGPTLYSAIDTTNADDEYLVSLTLEGTKENEFEGSSLEVSRAEIR